MNLSELNQTDRCLYFSCPERSLSAPLYILLYGSAAAVILLTLCGNLLVIISVSHFKQLHTPTNMLVLSLAVSDFLVGVLVMPAIFIWTIESCWILGTDYCVCFMIAAFFLTSLSIYQVALIAVDRYFALSNPFVYTNSVSVSTIQTVILSNWCVLLSYNVLIHYFNESFTSLLVCPGECFVPLNEILAAIDLVITFIFPCAVIIILYTRVFVIARKHANAIRQTHTDSMKTERKAAKVLSILVSVFLICLLPYFIYCSLGGFIEIQLETFQKLCIVLYINSTINPVIYALFYPWFRRCVKIILTRQIFQTNSSLMNVL